MDYYLDILLKPDPEFPTPILMNALFAKLHRILAQLQSKEIGVSFPGIAERSLGSRLRLHGTSSGLEDLMAQRWLKGMHDYIEITDIQPVPEQAGYCRVQRVQAKSSAERLRRRYQKRHPEAQEDSLTDLIPDEVEHRLDLPYVRLKSWSSGQEFLLFIMQSKSSEPSSGVFNTYGLSQSATLPWF